MRSLEAVPLTAEDFAPFGDVIDCRGHEPRDMNDGMALRWVDLAFPRTDAAGRVSIGRVYSRRYDLPFPLRLVERHPLGSQAFVPLDETPYLVVVAAAGPPPRPGDLRLFLARDRQGIQYRCGVWHAPLLTSFAAMEFVVVDRTGPGDNCEEHRFDASEAVFIPPIQPD